MEVGGQGEGCPRGQNGGRGGGMQQIGRGGGGLLTVRAHVGQTLIKTEYRHRDGGGRLIKYTGKRGRIRTHVEGHQERFRPPPPNTPPPPTPSWHVSLALETLPPTHSACTPPQYPPKTLPRSLRLLERCPPPPSIPPGPLCIALSALKLPISRLFGILHGLICVKAEGWFC